MDISPKSNQFDQCAFFPPPGTVERMSTLNLSPFATQLLINDLQEEDTGTYYCVIGPIRYPYNITVEGKTLVGLQVKEGRLGSVFLLTVPVCHPASNQRSPGGRYWYLLLCDRAY